MCLQARLKNWKGAGCTKVGNVFQEVEGFTMYVIILSSMKISYIVNLPKEYDSVTSDYD